MGISRRKFIASATALSSGLATQSCNKSKDNSPTIKQPNIILFLTDDQRYDTLGCTGHPFIKTPAIDWLAQNGCLFQKTFVTTPICAASRASILTGQHERAHGYTFGSQPLSNDQLTNTYPSILKRNGYKNGFIGKFGVRVEKEYITESFDYFKLIDRASYYHKLPNGETVHEIDAATFYAKEFIDDSIGSTKPFSVSVSFNAPHAANSIKVNTPYPSPNSTKGMYEDTIIPDSRLSEQKIFESLPLFLKTSLNRQRYFWRWDQPEQYQENMRDYYSLISGVDNAIGEILEHLKATGELDNTVIIFSSDNGYYLGDKGFAGKWSHFEQSMHVPLIIFDPRINSNLKGVQSNSIALNIDLCPTILDFAGINDLNLSSGRSLKPIVQKQPNSWRKDFLCEHLRQHVDIPRWEGVRSNQYVYARYIDQNPDFEFLHDLQSDPAEKINLANHNNYQQIIKKLRRRCDQLIDINS